MNLMCQDREGIHMLIKKKVRPVQIRDGKTVDFKCTGIRMEGSEFFYGFQAVLPEKYETVLLQGIFTSNGEIRGNVSRIVEACKEISGEIKSGLLKDDGPIDGMIELTVGKDTYSFPCAVKFTPVLDMCMVSMETEPDHGAENDVYINQRGEAVQDILLGVKVQIKAADGWRFKELKSYELTLSNQQLKQPLRYCAPAKRHKKEFGDKDICICFPEPWKNQIPVRMLTGNDAIFTLDFCFTADMEREDMDGDGEMIHGCRTMMWDSRRRKSEVPLKTQTLKWEDDV